MKSFSSAYVGTLENDFAKSKQRQGKLDVFLAVFNIILCGQSRMSAPADLLLKHFVFPFIVGDIPSPTLR